MGDGVVYARCTHAALDNPRGLLPSRCYYTNTVHPNPHVVQGVLLHVIPVSWSWAHLLPLCGVSCGHAPHPVFLSQRVCFWGSL